MRNNKSCTALCTVRRVSRRATILSNHGETPGCRHSLSTSFREAAEEKTTSGSRSLARTDGTNFFHVSSRVVNAYGTVAIYGRTSAKTFGTGQIEATRSSTDFLRREFRNTREVEAAEKAFLRSRLLARNEERVNE